jgi:hypothetical protein
MSVPNNDELHIFANMNSTPAIITKVMKGSVEENLNVDSNAPDAVDLLTAAIVTVSSAAIPSTAAPPSVAAIPTIAETTSVAATPTVAAPPSEAATVVPTTMTTATSITPQNPDELYKSADKLLDLVRKDAPEIGDDHSNNVLNRQAILSYNEVKELIKSLADSNPDSTIPTTEAQTRIKSLTNLKDKMEKYANEIVTDVDKNKEFKSDMIDNVDEKQMYETVVAAAKQIYTPTSEKAGGRGRTKKRVSRNIRSTRKRAMLSRRTMSNRKIVRPSRRR